MLVLQLVLKSGLECVWVESTLEAWARFRWTWVALALRFGGYREVSFLMHTPAQLGRTAPAKVDFDSIESMLILALSRCRS